MYSVATSIPSQISLSQALLTRVYEYGT
ncbi:hypothetical protein E2C01_099886 [Portunus trituberculatus]|uniref:Uncharacterized protein n=1 Tax=Portunus trituberculatus TaxID=210409 RepID=A0A5B7K1I5_PORTR|nr:hypothetical protein [Portunus trituberculatus]